MAQLTMYPAKSGSKRTTLTADLSVNGIQAFVGDLSSFPAAPNLITFKSDETIWETCLYTEKSAESGAGYLTITRSGEGHDSSASGSALSWNSGASAFRSPTGLDHDRFKANIEDLNANKQNLDATLTAIAGLTTAANKLPYATGEDAFDVCDFTALGRSLVGTTTEADARDLISAASSTTDTQTIYVDKAATGSGTGENWENAFTTIQAAVNSLPAIINHAVVICVRKGSTAYAETITIQRVVGAGSITIQGEYYWSAVPDATGTAGCSAGSFAITNANAANMEAGDIIWMIKYTSTIEGSEPTTEVLPTTIASVTPGATYTTIAVKGCTNDFTTDTAKWVYYIVKTQIATSGSTGITIAQSNYVTISGLHIEASICLNPKGCLNFQVNTCSLKLKGTGHAILSQFGTCGVNNTSPIRAAMWSDTTFSTPCAITTSANSFMSGRACLISFKNASGTPNTNSCGIYNNFHTFCRLLYSSIVNTAIGLKAEHNSTIYKGGVRNTATTPLSPASSSDGACIV